MGLWGAAQALAFGLGGFVGTVGADLARHITQSPATAYEIVFVGEALLFLVAAVLSAGASARDAPAGRPIASGSKAAVGAGA
jgi:BCD family chlorophyll transporter-like MFS transporter